MTNKIIAVCAQNGYTVNICPIIGDTNGCIVEFPPNILVEPKLDPYICTYIIIDNGLEIYHNNNGNIHCDTVNLQKYQIKPYIIVDIFRRCDIRNIPKELIIVKIDDEIFEAFYLFKLINLDMLVEEEDKEEKVIKSIQTMLYNNLSDYTDENFLTFLEEIEK